MKRAELKVKSEISNNILSYLHESGYKEHIGEIRIVANIIGENIIINCYYLDVQIIYLVVLHEEVVRFKVSEAGKGLIQLKWFLEKIKIKKDKECL